MVKLSQVTLPWGVPKRQGTSQSQSQAYLGWRVGVLGTRYLCHMAEQNVPHIIKALLYHSHSCVCIRTCSEGYRPNMNNPLIQPCLRHPTHTPNRRPANLWVMFHILIWCNAMGSHSPNDVIGSRRTLFSVVGRYQYNSWCS